MSNMLLTVNLICRDHKDAKQVVDKKKKYDILREVITDNLPEYII